MDPRLAALLERAKQHVMTPAEIAAQRRSWVRGELMFEHPEMSFEEADKRVREVERVMHGEELPAPVEGERS